LLATCEGWVAVNLARPEDAELVPALTGRDGDLWDALAAAARKCTAAELVTRGVELQLPIAELGEAKAVTLASGSGEASGLRVLDLSVLWAGPLCAGLLARAGARVTRIENLARPDPTPLSSPRLDRWLNAAKTLLQLDLSAADDRAKLCDAVAAADVVVTSARPRALAALGLEDDLLAARPELIWAAVTAHGWAGNRVGFGDDCAVAGGLVGWEGGAPRFVGDALADPLTGLEGALAVLERIGEGRGGRIDLAMARIAAAYCAGAAA
jgi:crotonobetainyl-CoA:carnitine CoA-transferase CaiB-like acyl-CoA transferase